MNNEISSYERLKKVIEDNKSNVDYTCPAGSFSSGIPTAFYLVYENEEGVYGSDFDNFKLWLNLHEEIFNLIAKFPKIKYNIDQKLLKEKFDRSLKIFHENEASIKGFTDRLVSRLNNDSSYTRVFLRLDTTLKMTIANIDTKHTNKVYLDVDVFSWATIADIFDVVVPELLKK